MIQHGKIKFPCLSSGILMAGLFSSVSTLSRDTHAQRLRTDHGHKIRSVIYPGRDPKLTENLSQAICILGSRKKHRHL